MIKMVMNPGGNEKVFDLAETPDFLLVQFFGLIIRHQDLGNLEVQNTLRAIADAFRAKANNNIKDGVNCSVTVNQSEIKQIIEMIDEFLKKADASVPV